MGLFDSSGPDAPTPPNPIATAAAQTGTNVSTAIANSYLGSINQNTPQGALNYDVTGNYGYTDPTTGQSYNIPRWTATQTLSPQYTAIQGQTDAAKMNMAGIANQQSGAIGGLLATPFNSNFNAQQYLQNNPDVLAYARNNGLDPNAFAAQHYQNNGIGEGRAGGTPNMGDINTFNQVGAPQSEIGATPGLTGGYASGGDITRDYGPQDNFSADRQRVEQSMFERVNPQIQQDEQRLRQQLADQGIRYGSQAYTGAYDPFNRQVTDTRLGIVAAGGAEQQRMNQMAQQRALFQNQAQAQAEGQNAARAGFYNTYAQGTFDQAAARGQFYNAAQNQNLGRVSAVFNAQNQLRNQALQEQYQQRNQPLNEIAALMSGSQVSAPNFINAQRTTIPTTDVAGLINQNFSQQNDIYKTQTGTFNDIMGGLIGGGAKLGAAALTPVASDVRVKENIEPMGSVLSNKGTLPLYAYDYKGDFDDGKRHFGPMAQDVEKLEPKAVKTIGGVKHIDVDKMGSIFGDRDHA
jgi:hypothetical protein